MSLWGYKKKWKPRTYLGPAAVLKNKIAAAKPKKTLFGFPFKVLPASSFPPGVAGAILAFDEHGNVDPRRSVVLRNAAVAKRKPSPTTLDRRARKRRRDRLYIVARDAYLARPENMWDKIELALTGILRRATHVHHIRGRHRTLLFDERYWCATSEKRDLWPHENVEWARREGLIAQRGDWRREPGDDETRRLEAWMREERVW